MEDRNDLVKDLFLLQRVAQRLNTNLDIDSLLTEVVNDVSQTFGCSRLAVLLKDEATDELVVGADCGGDFNLHIKGERFKVGEYGMTGHVGATGETYYAPDVAVDPYYKVSDSQTRSEVDIPLRSQGRLIGVFNAQSKELNGFAPARIQLLEALAGHVATAIENARLFRQERVEKERMLQELGEARRIQQSLFPHHPPELPGFTLSGLCIPCREVGGDWFDFIPLDNQRVGIVLADVSGKGMGAALLMSSTRTVLRLVAEHSLAPGNALARVNRILLSDFPSAKFVTMVYAVLDPLQRTVTIASAGHPPPLLCDASGLHFLETDAGLPLGIQEGTFSERTAILGPGMRMLLYSDGVTEAMNSQEEQYGPDRLRAAFSDRGASVQKILEDIGRFTEGRPATDDTTAVMIESNS